MLRLPYYGHYINEASLYVKVHLRSGYMLSVIKGVALPPSHWFHLRGRWLRLVVDMLGL